jgi:small nuclear ribonucleoprotein
METVRPLDVLNRTKGKEITVLLKNNQTFKGKLKAFDIHLNIVLFETFEIVENKTIDVGDMIIRGDAIITIQNI